MDSSPASKGDATGTKIFNRWPETRVEDASSTS
jgi:hypothetical protein